MTDDEIADIVMNGQDFGDRDERMRVGSAVYEAIRLTRQSVLAQLAAMVDAAIQQAAYKWRNEKDRETSVEDDTYFKNNWRALPGLEAYVHRELGRAALVAVKEGL